jgi:hypothetical protein
VNTEAKENYDEINDVFGLPQKYKEIEFYPLLVKDLEYIKLFNAIFTFPKLAASSTKRLYKMSYFKYVIIELRIPQKMIEKFFKHVTKKEDVEILFFNTKGKAETLEDLDEGIFQLRIEKTIFSEEEFENLREIILEQNGTDIDYINQYNSELEESLKWMQKEYPLTFNDQIFTISVLFKSLPKDIADWTLYQLMDIFDRLIVLKQYETYEPLIASGQVKMKNGKLQSYLYHKQKKNRYESVLMSPEEFDKIESELTGKNSTK